MQLLIKRIVDGVEKRKVIDNVVKVTENGEGGLIAFSFDNWAWEEIELNGQITVEIR